jgi:hypothetical protein
MFWNKKVFSFNEGVAVDVVDVAAARRCYSEKLGLTYSSTKVEVVLGYSEHEPQVYLSGVIDHLRPDLIPGRPPILFAKKPETAHEHLSSRGVGVGPLQTDSGGSRFFRSRDLEGNEVEVCQQT